MKREEYTHYLAAVESYQAHDHRRLTQLLDGDKLSQVEKNLIRARLEIRDARHQDAFDILQKIAPPNAFFAGEKWVLLGNYHFFRGDFEEAAVANLTALEHYRRIEDHTGLFYATYNLSVDFSRMGHERVSEYYLRQAESFAQSPRESSLVYRALACYHSTEENHDEACRRMDQAIALRGSLSFNDQMALETVAADVYFRAGQETKSLEILRRLYEDRRRNRERPRIEFEYKVLECHMMGHALPAAMPPGIEESKEHALKWKILRAVQTGEPVRAIQLWEELRELAPKLYGSNFSGLTPSEERSLFLTYLKRWRKEPSDDEMAMAEFKPSGKLGLLHDALWKASTPLSKEQLIEAVWKVPYDITYDLRFYKLIERLKKLAPLTLVIENRAYRYQRAPVRP